MLKRLLLTGLIGLTAQTLYAADLAAGLQHLAEGRHAEARMELEPLALEGDAEAQFNLGTLYTLGLGVPISQEKAVEWFSKAANGYHYEAANTLAKMYLSGVGVKQDQEKAMYWMGWAAKIAEATQKEQECE